MGFKISAYMQVGEEQSNLHNYSNCSKFSLTKDNIYLPGDDENYFSNIYLDIYENSTSEHLTYRTLAAKPKMMLHLSSIDLLNTSKSLIRSIEATKLSEENSDDYIFTVEKLKNEGFKTADLTTESTVYVRFKYSVCKSIVYTQSKQKYFGYPKIIYGDSNNRTIIRDYIALTSDTKRFWVCENKAGEFATQFKKWRIYLYKLTVKKVNGDDVYTSDLIKQDDYTYNGPTHFLSSVQFYRPEVDASNLVLVRNENLIKYDDLQNTQVYNTYENLLIEGNDSNENSDETICYYFVIEAEYTPKSPRVVFWKRNGDGMFQKSYTYGDDLRNQNLTGSEINMTKYGYNFDGYYIKSYGDNNDIKPDQYTTLHDKGDEYRKIVNTNGTFISEVKNFTGDDCEYINIIPEKYAFANWIPKDTTIKLNWNIEHVESGSKITINGKDASDTMIKYLNALDSSVYAHYGLSYLTTEKYNTTCENLIRDKGVNIPVITETVGKQTITWEFAGFYKEKGLSEKIIREDGVFKRNTSYTSAKKWRTDKSEVTLYAKWIKGAYYEVDKDGFEGAWGSCPDGYKAYYGSGSHTTPKGNKQLDMYKPYLCEYENGDYVRDAEGNPVIDNDMNFDGYYLYSEDGTRGEQIVHSDGKFKLYTSCTNGVRRNKKEGKVNLYAYWYGDKFRIQTESDNTKLGTTSGGGRYKKTTNCTIKATVKDSEKYCFLGWQKDGVSLQNGYISSNPNYTFKVEKAEKYIGYFGTKSYTINYKDVGGAKCTAENYIDLTSPVITSGIYSKDDNILPMFTTYWGTIIPNAYKKGYIFKGWYTNSTGTTKLDTDNGKYIINEGVTNDITLYASWEPEPKVEFTVWLDLSKYIPGSARGHITVETDEILDVIPTTYKPTVDKHSFCGYKDKYGKLVINKDCKWIKGTEYCDVNGKCTITKELCDTTSSIVLYAYYIRDFDIIDGGGFKRQFPITCNVTKIDELNFQKYYEDKIATINWINKAIGIPEIEYYENQQEHFYTDEMININENYTSNKTIADKYFFYDFVNENDNKCLTQGDIVDFFNNQATEYTTKVYIKSIERDEDNKVFLKFAFTSTPANSLFYITINDNKNIVYKFDFSTIGSLSVVGNITLSYIDVEIPDFYDNINKITIEQIPSYVTNSNGTSIYYRHNIVFNKFKDLNLTIEKNTILNNVEIKDYESDVLLEQVPGFPGGIA